MVVVFQRKEKVKAHSGLAMTFDRVCKSDMENYFMDNRLYLKGLL